MKILMSIHHVLDRNSGAPGATINLAEAMIRQGVDVELLSYDNFNLRDDIVSQFQYPLRVQRHLLHHAKEFEIIDASTGDTWVNLIRRRPSGPKIVTRSHGLEHTAYWATESRNGVIGLDRLSWKFRRYQTFRLWQVALTLRKADLNLFLNEQDRAFSVQHLGVSHSRTAKVANGIPSTFLNRSVSFDLPYILRIANIGTFTTQKGIYYDCSALNSILIHYPNVMVSFVGTGVPAREVLQLFDPIVHSRITVIPKYAHESLPQLLQGHQIFFFPTLSEGFGMALVEAMAMGLAPVTTDTAGPREIVEHETNGIMVAARDSQALKGAVERLLKNPRLLTDLRINAFYAAQKYGWDDIASNTIALYNQII